MVTEGDVRKTWYVAGRKYFQVYSLSMKAVGL